MQFHIQFFLQFLDYIHTKFKLSHYFIKFTKHLRPTYSVRNHTKLNDYF